VISAQLTVNGEKKVSGFSVQVSGSGSFSRNLTPETRHPARRPDTRNLKETTDEN